MKSVLQSLAIVFASMVLLSSCGHFGHGGKSCGCSADAKAAGKCEHHAETTNKDGKKMECEDCKKGS